MKITCVSKYFKVVRPKGKEYAILKVLDLPNVECYAFFIPVVDGLMFDSAKKNGETVYFYGYSTYKEGVYKTYLSSAETESGDHLYEYTKD